MYLEFRNFSKRTVYTSIVVVVVLIVLLIIPLSLSRTVSVAGKVLPAREWLLVKNAQGSVLATLSDNLQGNVGNYTAVTVVRGDAFGFSLRSALKPGDTVRAGDTVVNIYSHDLVRQVQQLSGQLAVARSNLAVVRSGEKQPVTAEAERSLILEKEQATLQHTLFKRQDSLYGKNLISTEEYDLARSAMQSADISVAIAQAKLEAVSTGSKPEQIRMIESQIAALQRELLALSEQVAALTVVSPLTGVLLPSPSADTLCVIEDTTRVLLVVVPVEYMSRIVAGEKVTFRVPRRTETYSGAVARVDHRVRVLLGRQVIMATATLAGSTAALPSNLVMAASIETDRVSLARFVEYWIADLWNEVLGATAGA